jgi:hypothetical protein
MGAGASGAFGEGLYGELDLFGAPPSMNIADDRPPEASSGAGEDKDAED